MSGRTDPATGLEAAGAHPSWGRMNRHPRRGIKPTAASYITINPERQRPNPQTVIVQQKDQPSESWWQRFATGPRDGAFHGECLKRAPLMKPDNVRLRIWTVE
jgi:hypothetical protein